MCKRPKILIVDDEPTIVQGLTFRLRAAGYETIAAYDGPEALVASVKERPALILLDRQLPSMDGLDVLAALKDRDETKQTSVVMLSGCDADRQQAIATGAVAFLTKPYRGEELRKRIDNLFADQGVAVD